VTFHECTVALDGAIQNQRTLDSEGLDSAAKQVFADLLEGHGSKFRVTIKVDDVGDVNLSWSSVGSSALATWFLEEDLTTTSALMAGADAEADKDVLWYFQEILNTAAAATGQPAPKLAEVADRPLVLLLHWRTRRPDEMKRVADMTACLASAFFGRGAFRIL
jgi:hypothetical protein